MVPVSLLIASLCLAQSVKEEHADLAERLTTEKAALEGLRAQKVSLAEVLSLLDTRGKAQLKRHKRVELELKAVQRQIELAEKREAWAREVVRIKVEQLSPRLLVLYRMKRRNPLDVLLSAKDFASLMRTSRSMGQLLERDLQLLEDVRVANAYQAESLAELDRLNVSLAERMDNLEEEREADEEQRMELQDLLASTIAESRQSSRAVKDLEVAEHQLAELIHELDHPPENGFGALRGKLLMPVDGIIEVGFGKIVNPKFNTVILQKGIDVRAAPGSDVRAVAAGKVVHTGWVRGYGNVMIVEHPGTFHTVMAHLGEIIRHVGEEVTAGDALAKVGDSGSL
ncbi:MAG: murein hydrolase activator EnvC family protein, partial [Myxococcaceae bacterium]